MSLSVWCSLCFKFFIYDYTFSSSTDLGIQSENALKRHKVQFVMQMALWKSYKCMSSNGHQIINEKEQKWERTDLTSVISTVDFLFAVEVIHGNSVLSASNRSVIATLSSQARTVQDSTTAMLWGTDLNNPANPGATIPDSWSTHLNRKQRNIARC